MSCNHCTTKFNFFHKEMGCASCGLSFCGKCLKQKCRVPSRGKTGEHPVCRTCHAKLNAGVAGPPAAPPPDGFIKRLETTTTKTNAACSTNTIDQRLIERLKSLKDDGSGAPPPSEAEIRERLARLRGRNHYMEGPSRPEAPRTDQQRIDALLEQFTNEREIELSHNPQEEIEARLATLRDRGVRPNEGPYMSNLRDSGDLEGDDVDSITRKIMDEVALDRRLDPKPELEPEPDPEPDPDPELPWCVLCNNDARFRCLDCGGDLYCATCNVEVHKTWGDTDHRVIPYGQRKS